MERAAKRHVDEPRCAPEQWPAPYYDVYVDDVRQGVTHLRFAKEPDAARPERLQWRLLYAAASSRAEMDAACTLGQEFPLA